MMIFVLGRQVYESRNPRLKVIMHAVEEKELVLKIGLLCSYPANSKA
jgi:hypothetical protein